MTDQMKRLSEIAHAIGQVRERLYSPWISTRYGTGNMTWTPGQVLDLAPGVFDKAFRAAEEAEQLVSAFIHQRHRMSVKVRYTLTLEVEGELSRDDRNWLADRLSSEAADAMCDINDGDSGSALVTFAGSGR